MKRVLGTTFRAMDTTVEAKVITNPAQVQKVKTVLSAMPAWFQRVEEVLSRFKPESELMRINSSGGYFLVSDLMAEVVDQALQAAEVTNGIFDPTILGELEEAGYSRTFQDVINIAGAGSRPAIDKERPVKQKARRQALKQSCQDIKLDRFQRILAIPQGVSLDLGGIAKGWAVDQSFLRLREICGKAEICVNAGGDLRLAAVGGKPWSIVIENPQAKSKDLLTLTLSDGAVATSSVFKRRWYHQGRWQHHLIDPRLGSPAQSPVGAATVAAPTVTEAEVWAKTLCILGPEEGFGLLSQKAAFGALIVLKNGNIIVNKEMERFLDAGNSESAIHVYS